MPRYLWEENPGSVTDRIKNLARAINAYINGGFLNVNNELTVPGWIEELDERMARLLHCKG